MSSPDDPGQPAVYDRAMASIEEAIRQAERRAVWHAIVGNRRAEGEALAAASGPRAELETVRASRAASIAAASQRNDD
jgi:hypothetical protein